MGFLLGVDHIGANLRQNVLFVERDLHDGVDGVDLMRRQPSQWRAKTIGGVVQKGPFLGNTGEQITSI